MFNQQDNVGGNFVTTTGALTGLSGAATTYSTGATAMNYAINGQLYSKAAVAGGATPAVDGSSGAAMTLAANQAAAFVWCVDAAGTVSVHKGPTAAWTAAEPVALQLPKNIPDTKVPFAISVIKAGPTTVGNWGFGTSNWNATGIVVDTVRNIAVPPGAPVLTA